MINVRNQNNYHCRCRIVIRSLDGGLTLPIEELFFDNKLVDPAVAAGALQKDGVLYFTNPSNEQHSKKPLTSRLCKKERLGPFKVLFHPLRSESDATMVADQWIVLGK